MKHKALTLILLAALLVPIVNAVTIDGPINFVATHGGNTRFTTIAATQINVIDNIYRFTGLSIGGVTRGNMGFDCSTGTNMTVTGITPNSITYTVASPALSTQYIYYANRQPYTQTGATGYTYDAATGIATVTANNASTVVLSYSNANPVINETFNYLPLLGASLLVMAASIILAGMRGELTVNSIIVLVIASVAVILTAVVLASFVGAIYSAGI